MPLRIAAALLVLPIVLAGCGGDEPGEQGDTEVLIETDAGPVGLPALRGGDGASGTQNERVPITSKGVPTAIYAVRLDDLEAGDRVGALATVTLTKCAITDYIPNARGFTACEGTKEYRYDPVEVESGFRLVGGPKAPDLSDRGAEVGEPVATKCTTAIHHCTLSQEGLLDLSSPDLVADAKWLVFEVTAKSPKAAACGSDPTRCNVLAVETQKGTAMYGVKVRGKPLAPKSLPADTTPSNESLKVLINRGDKDDVRQVIYSVPLTSASGLKDLQGDQMEVQARLEIDEKLPQAPDIANFIVLSDKPDSIEGRYLLSDSYNPGKTGNNGENCDGSCSFDRAAAITTILRCDVKAGRRFVNFVADASRADAKRGETVQVGDGGYLKVTDYYEADITSDRQSVGNCNR